MLGYDEKVAICAVKSFVRIHVLPRSIYVHANSSLHGRISCAGNEVKAMDPVDGLVQIERIPSKLIRYLVDLLARLVIGIGIESGVLARLE